MKILIASSEVHPYSKSGGLADMVGAMAKSLSQQGSTVGVVTPLYRGIRDKFPDIRQFEWEMELPLGNRLVPANVWVLEPAPHLNIYFIDLPEFFDRDGLYGANGADYSDNAERFIFFSKAVTHLARYLPWRPEIVHAHDWQTGLVPLMILHQSIWEGWGHPPKTFYTIHNLAYQGVFDDWYYQFTNLSSDYFQPHGLEFYGRMSCMKAGIVYSDQLSTVSRRYAEEILTPEFGCGLEGVLQDRRDALVGILNGVDYEEWKTSRNPNLKYSYSATRLAGKRKDKGALQAEFGLPVTDNVPLFGNITRLVEQKGVDIQLEALEEMLESNDMQFVLLGSGDPKFEEAYEALVQRFPEKAAARIGYDQGLAHRIEAGADFYLMPSRFEPCGLNQMYSLRYGTIPIVRKTGGLDDSVTDIIEDVGEANGIKFDSISAPALAKAIKKAVVLFEHKDLLAHYRQNGMKADYGWKRTASHYLALYRGLTKESEEIHPERSK